MTAKVAAGSVGATHNDTVLNFGTDEKEDAEPPNNDCDDGVDDNIPTYEGEEFEDNGNEQRDLGADVVGRSSRDAGRNVKCEHEDARDRFRERQVSQHEDYDNDKEEAWLVA